MCVLGAGWTVGDAILGRYLNPRIFNVDLKMLFLFNIGTLGHLAMCTIMLVETFHRDKLNAALILLTSYSLILGLVFTAYQV